MFLIISQALMIMASSKSTTLLLFLSFLLAPYEVRSTGVSVVRGRIPSPPATVFNVLHFGAKPDGRTESTKAFQDAWAAACSCSGNSRMLVPKGEFLVGQLHFEGPCKSSYPITFQVKGTVRATIDVSKYQDGEWIKFETIDGFKLNGGGTFDGQGPAVWGKHSCGGSSSKCGSRAVNIKFFKLKNVKLGKITSLNPKGFHMCINTCENFVAKRIKIVAPGDSPNTDGIHIGHSTNVRIVHSIISTGDDCVSIIDGSTRVTVADVYCGPGHGISVGSLGKNNDEKDVRAIFVKNCTLSDTTNGVRIKTWRGSAPSAGDNIHFNDIVMNNVQNPIVINQEYCDKTENCRGNQPSRVKLSNISFKKIRGTSTTKHAVKLRCSSAAPCENVQMFDVNLQYSVNTSQLLPALSECSNIRVNAGGVQFPPPCV